MEERRHRLREEMMRHRKRIAIENEPTLDAPEFEDLEESQDSGQPDLCFTHAAPEL